jgi:hypothetical protein
VQSYDLTPELHQRILNTIAGLAPVTVLGITLTSMLGSLNLMLLFVSLGCGCRAGWQIAVAGWSAVITMINFAWITPGLGRYWLHTFCDFFEPIDLLLFSILVLAALWAGLFFSRSLSGSRAVIIPLAGAGLLVGILFFLTDYLSYSQMYNLGWAASALAPFNPWGIPHGTCLGLLNWPDAPYWPQRIEHFRWPALLVLQLIMLAMLSREALQSVRLWRQAGERD